MSTAVDERAVASAQRPGEELSHRQILEVMAGLLAALFTALISSTIVSTALPTIMSDLHGTQRQYTWVITATLLAMTISTPIMGKLSDLINKKLLLQASIVLFVLGSVAAGASQEIWQMMVARAAQGVAMGGLTALVQSIMGSIIAPRQRGRYTGYMGAVMAVATVSGPLLGGVITDNMSWRWCFYVCVPLAVISLVVLQVTLKLPALPKRKVKIDYLGAILLAITAAAPMLWVTFAGKDYDWISWESAGFLAVFLVAAGLAIVVELKHSEPMVPIRVMANRTTALMIVTGIAVGVSMFGAGTFLTQYFQLAGGHSPTKAGLMIIPMILSQLLSSVIGGQIVSRTGRWKPIMLVGAVLLVVGFGSMGFIDHSTDYWVVAVMMAVGGIGVGLLIQNIVLAVQNTVDVSDIGAASATVAFFRSLGGAVGVSMLGALLTDQVATKTTDGIRALPAHLQAAAAKLMGGGGGEGNLDLGALPGPIREVVRHGYGDTFGLLFMIAGLIGVFGLLAIVFVKEVPLRTTVAMDKSAEQASAAVEGDGQDVPAVATVAAVAANGATAVALNGRRTDDWDPNELDDESERTAVEALDVLAAAHERAQRQEEAIKMRLDWLVAKFDDVTHEIDATIGSFHRQVSEVRNQLVAERTRGGSFAKPDGAGGDGLREYEYKLLLDSQAVAERVTGTARAQADRILAEAQEERAEIEQRIEALREVERELSDRLSSSLRSSDIADSRTT